MKKLWFCLIIMALGATTALFAQEKSAKTRIQERIAYMKEHVQLSGRESQTFWTVYEEYLNKEMGAMDKYRKDLEKQGIKLGTPGTNKEVIAKLTDKQLTYLQDRKFELRKTLLDLEVSYYKKYKAILTPRHLQDLYNAEYTYKKEMTKKKREGGQDDAGHVNTGKKKR